MSRLHASKMIGKQLFQWTQQKCDGCEKLDPATIQGHERGILKPPAGWSEAVVDGVLRSFCPSCRRGCP